VPVGGGWSRSWGVAGGGVSAIVLLMAKPTCSQLQFNAYDSTLDARDGTSRCACGGPPRLSEDDDDPARHIPTNSSARSASSIDSAAAPAYRLSQVPDANSLRPRPEHAHPA